MHTDAVALLSACILDPGDEVSRLRKRVAALEEACRPFALQVSDAPAGTYADDVMLSDLSVMDYSGGPTLGDCRRLAALLEENGQ